MTQAQSVAIESSQINSSGVLLTTGGGTGLSTVGTNGQVLTSNGTTLSWVTPTAVTPGGSNTQVQFNSSGTFGGSANMTFNGTNLYLANPVGVGTSSPNFPVDVVSDANAAAVSIRGRASDNLSFYQFTNNSTGNTQYGYILGGPSEMRFAQNGANYITSYTNGSERMRIDSSGNVGINNSSPRQKLTVAGAVGGIQLALSNGGTNNFPWTMTSTQAFMVIATWNNGNGYAVIIVQGANANTAVVIASSNASGGNNAFDTNNSFASNSGNGISIFYNGGLLVLQTKTNFTAGAAGAYLNIFGM
jgi:hypothetical protein